MESAPIRFNLEVDSVQVHCTKCTESDHTIFHCPQTPPHTLLVVEPIIPEVFMLEGVFALHEQLTFQDIREAIAKACHMRPIRIVLTTKFLEVLDNNMPLQKFIEDQPFKTHFPTVIYALVQKLATSATRVLAHNCDLARTMESAKRALSLLSQWKHQPMERGSNTGSAPTVNRVKFALQNAIEEIRETLPEFTEQPVDETLMKAIHKGIEKLGHTPTPSIPSQPAYAAFTAPQNLRPPPPVQSAGGNQLSVNAPIFVPPTLRPNPNITRDEAPSTISETVTTRGSIMSVADLDELFSTKTNWSYEQFKNYLLNFPAFPSDLNYVNRLLKGRGSFLVLSHRICLIHNAYARKLFIELARFQFNQTQNATYRSISQYIMLKFQLHEAVTSQGDVPFGSAEWRRVQAFVETYEKFDYPSMNLFCASFRKLVGLSFEFEVPPSDCSTVIMFQRFQAMAVFSVTMGLTDSSVEYIKDTITALSAAKIIATKGWILKMKNPELTRADLCEIKVHDEHDHLLSRTELCHCLPILFQKFLTCYSKYTEAHQTERILETCNIAKTTCQSSWCFNNKYVNMTNVELYFFLDIFTHLTRQNPLSTAKEVAYANELQKVLVDFAKNTKQEVEKKQRSFQRRIKL